MNKDILYYIFKEHINDLETYKNLLLTCKDFYKVGKEKRIVRKFKRIKKKTIMVQKINWNEFYISASSYVYPFRNGLGGIQFSN